MLALVAGLIALASALASVRRAWLVASATELDGQGALDLLGRDDGARYVPALRRLCDAEPRAEWERELFHALDERDAERRTALVNEQLTELGYRLDRWASVPRVCARVSSSGAFLLATLVLRRGLVDVEALPSDLTDLLLGGLIGQAITVVALGLVGTTFCVAVHKQVAAYARTQRQAMHEAVERLEALVAARLEGGA